MLTENGCRFYESLPEISGLEVPESAPSPPSSLEAWLAGKLAGGRWAEMATEFCRVAAREPELLEEWTTALLLELSRLCGEFRLQVGLEVSTHCPTLHPPKIEEHPTDSFGQITAHHRQTRDNLINCRHSAFSF